MKHTLFHTPLLLVISILITSGLGYTQSISANGQFSFQGHLTTTNGTAIADGMHMLTANIYAAGSGQLVFTEIDTITTTGGIFSTMIGANGQAGSHLHVNADSGYQLGVAVDGEAELSPKISLASALSALTAQLAANASAVGGYGVSTADSAKANTVVVLNSNGKIHTSLLDSGVVTSINGVSGALSLQGGGDLGVSMQGNSLMLSFTGNGSGSLNFPFSKVLNIGAGSAFSVTNTLAGSAAMFSNTGLGNSLDVEATSGSAISASSSGSLLGAATVDVQNSGGTALNAVANASGSAVVTVKNKSGSASAKLFTAMDSTGSAVLDVAVNGKTTISATATDALSVSTSGIGAAITASSSASADAVLKLKNMSGAVSAKMLTALSATGDTLLNVAANGKTTITSTADNALEVSATTAGTAALKLTGGLTVSGPVGTGTVAMGTTLATINNAYVKANSIIMLTVNGGGAAAVPLQITQQATGSFVVSVFNGIGAVTGNVSFSYLVINQ